jgi:hypothetical protein
MLAVECSSNASIVSIGVDDTFIVVVVDFLAFDVSLLGILVKEEGPFI